MGTAPMTPGQMKDLISAATQAIPTHLTFDQATKLLGKKKKLGDKIRAAFCKSEETAVVEPPPTPPQAAVKLTFAQATENAYAMLDMGTEYSEFTTEFGDAQTPGKWTLKMVQAPGKLTVSKIIAALRTAGSKVDTWYTDPDKSVPHNARDCNSRGSYFLDLQPNADPDPEFAGKSQNDLKKSKGDKVSNNHITWLERWFLELVHFLMAGVNLDKNRIWTRCDGSLDSGGDVPCVLFDHGYCGVCGDYCGPDSSRADFCARSAVPRQPKRVGANS